MNRSKAPTFREIKMAGEIGSYQEDDAPPIVRRARAWCWPLLLLGAVAACGAPEAPDARRPSDPIELTAMQAEALNGGVITQAADNARDGWYQDEPALTPALVSGAQFGQAWRTQVGAEVDAQPLPFGSTLLVATENNTILVLDQATGAVLASRQVEPNAWDPHDVNVPGDSCDDIVPTIGSLSTGVADSATNVWYFTSKSYARGGSGAAIWQMHAVDATTLAERCGFPVIISGTAQNDSTLTFDPVHQSQRAGLLLLNGVVYAGFGSHCDLGSWQGWVAGISTSGALVSLWTTEAGQGIDGNGGVWQGGAGLASDGTSVFFATGNGRNPSAPVPGSTPPGAMGDAVVRLAVNGAPHAVDFFMPATATSLDAPDLDLSSGGTVLLPDAWGTTSVPHTAVQIGKQGTIYLLNRDSLGGFQQGPGGGDAVVQEIANGGLQISQAGNIYGRPAVNPVDGYLYYDTSTGYYGSGAGPLVAYAHGVSGNHPTLTLAGQSVDAFDSSSGSPVVSSNGSAAGSAVVWVVRSTSSNGAGAELRAYGPVPSGGTLPLLGRWGVGTGTKFQSPSIANGRVFVPTRDGAVVAFGALPQPDGGTDSGSDAVAESGSGGGGDATTDAQDAPAPGDAGSDVLDATTGEAATDASDAADGSDAADTGVLATPHLVQIAEYESDGTNVTSMAATLTHAVSLHDLIVVQAYTWNATGVASISDSAGNAWHHAIFQSDPQRGTNGLDVWYVYDAKASNNDAVTVRLTTQGAWEGIVVAEYSGVQWIADPLDVAHGAAHTGSGNTAPTVSLTTALAGELLVSGAGGGCSGESTAGTGYTLGWGLAGIGAIYQDRVVASAGATSATSGPADCDWTITGAAFKAAH
jgi:hypothetical protein